MQNQVLFLKRTIRGALRSGKNQLSLKGAGGVPMIPPVINYAPVAQLDRAAVS